MAETGNQDHLFEATPPAHSPDGRYRAQMFDETTVDGVTVRGRARLHYDGDNTARRLERPQEAQPSSGASSARLLHAEVRDARALLGSTGPGAGFSSIARPSSASARPLRERECWISRPWPPNTRTPTRRSASGLNDGRLISRAATIVGIRLRRKPRRQQRGFDECRGNAEAARGPGNSVSGEHGPCPFLVAQAERALGARRHRRRATRCPGALATPEPTQGA